MCTTAAACGHKVSISALAIVLGAALAAAPPPADAQPAVRGAPLDSPGAGSRSPSTDAARAPAPSACSDCGIVQAVERRDRRARWSSIVGTPAAQSPLPDTMRPLPSAAADSGASSRANQPPGNEQAGGPAGTASGRAQPQSAAGRNEPPVAWVPGRGAPIAPAGRDSFAGRDPSTAAGARNQPSPGSTQDEPARSNMPVASGETRPREPSDSLHRNSGWRVVLRMDDGSTRSIDVDAQPELHVGDRVRLKGSQIYLR